MTGDILSNEERVQEFKLLFQEACLVVHSIDPALTPKFFLESVMWVMIRVPDAHPPLWQLVHTGCVTNIDMDNGFLIKYGRGMTPTHVKYFNIVMEKSTERARAISADEADRGCSPNSKGKGRG